MDDNVDGAVDSDGVLWVGEFDRVFALRQVPCLPTRGGALLRRRKRLDLSFAPFEARFASRSGDWVACRGLTLRRLLCLACHATVWCLCQSLWRDQLAHNARVSTRDFLQDLAELGAAEDLEASNDAQEVVANVARVRGQVSHLVIAWQN